jgi:hypothetical protein
LYQLAPIDPLPGQPVSLTVYTGIDLSANQVACYYTVDGSEPDGQRGQSENARVLFFEQSEVIWDAVAWGYVIRWRGTLPPQPEGTIVRYRIGAWSDTNDEVFADWPDVQEVAEKSAAAFFRGEKLPDVPLSKPDTPYTFTYHVDRLSPPAWAKDAVIYQVFVDRFYPGDDRNWLRANSLLDFYGGTLWGVRDKLAYIRDLGANCLWLSPVWSSPTHHGYDTTDFYQVEPRLGGNEALHTLVEAAHQHNIRIILDMACNHISDQHPIFQEALHNANSDYRQWFTFEDTEIGYRTFFGVPSMPEVNVHHPTAKQWLIDIARYWLREFDIDGYRLDYANGPGPDFWSDFRLACKAEKPDCFCFGEIVDHPASLRTYVGRLDGCLDFHLEDALRQTFAYHEWTEKDLERFIQRHYAYFEQAGDFILPTFLDNHDMNRFLFAANGDKEALRRAATFQMRLPQPPVIYYGTEVGLTQRSDKTTLGLEVSREPMPWGNHQDVDLFKYYQSLISKRISG